MPNPRLADRYAKSLVDFATEKNELDTVKTDMQYIDAVCKESRDFSNMLKSPIIKADQKEKMITAIVAGKVGAITAAFVNLLVKKGRESDLREIATAFINQYNAIKGIHKVKLTTAVAISTEAAKAIGDRVKQANNFDSVELETVVDGKLIGGFVLEFDNKLVDASVATDLREIKKQFAENTYIHNIR